MKKFLGIILLAFIAIAITGCGKEEQASNEINFWVYEPQSMAHKKEYESLIKKFEEQNDAVVRVSWIVKDNFNQRLNAAIMNKRNPDISYLDQPLMATYLKNEHIADLTNYINNSKVINLEEFFLPGIETVNFNGNYYGMPLTIGTSVLLYNKDLITQPEDIKSWDDWFQVSKDKSRADIAAFEGIGAGGYAGWYFGGFLKTAGSDLMNKDLTEVNIANKDSVEALTFLKKLYKLSPLSITSSQNPFGNGKVLFKLGGGSDIDSLRTNFPQLKFGAILMPPKNEGGPSYSSMGGDNLVVFKNSKNKDLAFKLIEFLVSKENALKIAEYTGNFPANNEAIGTAYDDDPERLVLRKQLETAVARPKIDKWIAVNDLVLGAAIEEILTTDIDIQERLNRAKKEAEAKLFN